MVTGGCPAGKGGLRAGDVIKPAGNAHRDAPALSGVLAAASPGQQVTLTLTGGSQDLTVSVRLGELPGS